MQITVQTTTIPNYQRSGSTATIRIYATENFFSEGLEYIAGQGYFYKEVDCTVSGNVVTVPPFTLASTTDSTVDTAKYRAVLLDAAGTRVSVLMGGLEFSVPPVDPTTWEDLMVYNQAVRRRMPDTFYDANQITTLLADLASGSAIYGIDGGAPSSVYLAGQVLNGGGVSD
jgi:hypothetical protein